MTSHLDELQSARRYGRWSAIAIGFHIETGNPAELDAAVIYARTAARLGNYLIDYLPAAELEELTK